MVPAGLVSTVPKPVRERRFDAKVGLPSGIERTVTLYRGNGYPA